MIELGHRFYPSEVAFPVDILTDMLERYAVEQAAANPQTHITRAWAAKTMLSAHVPPQLVFDVLLGLFDAGVSRRSNEGKGCAVLTKGSLLQREPFHSTQGQLFLLSDLATTARLWIEEMLGLAAPSLGLKDIAMGFSARRLDDALSGLLLSLGHLEGQPQDVGATTLRAEKIASSLKATQELLRRSF